MSPKVQCVTTAKQIHVQSLVINWHLTEACNYGCRYCYAAWNKSAGHEEVIRDPVETRELLQQVFDYFQPDNHANPLTQTMSWSSLRLNFAGGEPQLRGRKFDRAIELAKEIGFEVSVITNGSFLAEEWLEWFAPLASWLGISIDSALEATNLAVGRHGRKRNMLNLEGLTKQLSALRTRHPKLGLKVNTVVNRYNCGEDMSNLISSLAPNKWKVLRMLPVTSNELAVTDAQFMGFVTRHAHLNVVLCSEDNHDMEDSYLMLDPQGRFFQNGAAVTNGDYEYSQPVNTIGVQAAFAQMNFDPVKFAARY